MSQSKPEDNLTLCTPRSSSGQDPHNAILVRSPKPQACPQDHILIKIDRFGFSANNITYQALGEHPHFRYFDFHPAPQASSVSPSTHGVTPVWGFGTVIASAHPKISPNERIYGYFAPTRYLLLHVSPTDVNKHAFYVPRAHLPADRRPYNQIIRCAVDPHYEPSSFVEDLTMLYRPLFWTAFWCEDWLYSSKYRSATHMLISSASAKTAFCLAYCIKKRGEENANGNDQINSNLKIVGLTSPTNSLFTSSLRLYDEVLTYDTFSSSSTMQVRPEKRWIYIDVAGNEGLNQQIFNHFASPYSGTLAGCVQLGLTNLSPGVPDTNIRQNPLGSAPSSPLLSDSRELLAKSRPKETTSPLIASSQFWPMFESFFMPEWLAVRRHQLTIPQISDMQDRAWKGLMKDCVSWVQVKRICGGEEAQKAYESMLNGKRQSPEVGMVWSLWDKEDEIELRAKL